MFSMRTMMLATAFLTVGDVANAGIVVSNLGEAVAGVTAVNGPLGATEAWSSVKFTTGAGNWTLNSITAQFRDDSALNPDGLVIDIRNDAGLNPGGSVLGSLNPTSNIDAQANYGFTPAASISLSGNTSYWLVARPTQNTSLYGWFVTGSAADSGTSGWSLADDYAGTFDGGTNWVTLPAVPLLNIDATLAAVPEPATALFAGFIAAGVAVYRRRSRK